MVLEHAGYSSAPAIDSEFSYFHYCSLAWLEEIRNRFHDHVLCIDCVKYLKDRAESTLPQLAGRIKILCSSLQYSVWKDSRLSFNILNVYSKEDSISSTEEKPSLINLDSRPMNRRFCEAFMDSLHASCNLQEWIHKNVYIDKETVAVDSSDTTNKWQWVFHTRRGWWCHKPLQCWTYSSFW